MKEYRLANKAFKHINLKDYQTEIEVVVHLVKPNATVTVNDKGFIVEPLLSKREAIAVSTILRAGVMNEFTSYRTCLFLGYNIEDVENEKGNNKDE